MATSLGPFLDYNKEEVYQWLWERDMHVQFGATIASQAYRVSATGDRTPISRDSMSAESSALANQAITVLDDLNADELSMWLGTEMTPNLYLGVEVDNTDTVFLTARQGSDEGEPIEKEALAPERLKDQLSTTVLRYVMQFGNQAYRAVFRP